MLTRLQELEVHRFSEERVAAEPCFVGVRDGVDDEFGEVEVGGEVAELEGYFAGGADEVAGPFGVFRGVERAGGEGDERVGGGGSFAEFDEGVFGGGYGAAVVHADAALEEADGGVEVVGFGVGIGTDDADGEGGFGGGAGCLNCRRSR